MIDHKLIGSPSSRPEAIPRPSFLPSDRLPAPFPRRLKILAALTVLLAVCFATPLRSLARYALHSDLYSHVLLIPFISLYLIWLRKQDLALASGPVRRLAIIPLMVGVAALGAYWFALHAGWKPRRDDYLALMTLSWWSFLLAGGFLMLGAETLRRLAFPLSFLVFTVPFPTIVLEWIKAFLQQGSADAAHALFWLSGTPLARQGFQFDLPGFSLEVAPQCSGLHSSLVLFITSLLAGYLFLRAPWRRAVLTLAVIPLALVRNGFRIFVIGELCVNVSPDMVTSNIHRKGGPIFFALSLIPFFLLLLLLRRSESKRRATVGP
jgi:exosortase C (VPDSG-CTERM-specific)